MDETNRVPDHYFFSWEKVTPEPQAPPPAPDLNFASEDMEQSIADLIDGKRPDNMRSITTDLGTLLFDSMQVNRSEVPPSPWLPILENEIKPLADQIARLCKEYGIPFVFAVQSHPVQTEGPHMEGGNLVQQERGFMAVSLNLTPEAMSSLVQMARLLIGEDMHNPENWQF